MVINRKVRKRVNIDEVVDVLCNECGQTCSNLVRYHKADKKNICGYSGLIELEVHGGFDSEFIGDMTSWRFSLCEGCLNSLVSKFCIPHDVREDSTGDKYIPNNELQQYRNSYDKKMKQLNRKLEKDYRKKGIL